MEACIVCGLHVSDKNEINEINPKMKVTLRVEGGRVKNSEIEGMQEGNE